MATKRQPKGSKQRRAGVRKRPGAVQKQRPQLLRLMLKVGVVLLVVAACGFIYLDAKVRYTFSAKKWAVPARVYARPLELYVGMPLRRQDFEQELQQLGYQSVSRAGSPGQVARSGSEYRIHTRGFHFWDAVEQARNVRVRFGEQGIVGLEAAGGGAVVRLEPAQIGSIYPAHNEDRILVRLQDVPPVLTRMLITMEDRSFYEHAGVSPQAIARAAWANLRAGRYVQGGSTLTQQLVKNYYLSPDRSLLRKLIEAMMALSLDLHYSKDEILEGYLNEIFLGQDGQRAIHGFGLASQYYFNQPIGDLQLHQLALLVALVRGPSYYDPWRHPERALERRDLVLATLQEQGGEDAAAVQRAMALPLGVGRRYESYRRGYPAYLDLVRRQLLHDYRQEDLNSEGLVIFTNLDPLVQQGVEQSLAAVIERIEARHGDLKMLEGALVISQPETGSVLAVVGGRNVRYAGFNRALDALRPIGSLVKPAVYLAALDSRRFTLASPLKDEPLTVDLPNGDRWEPRNFDRKSHGEVPLFVALAKSYNLATAWLGLDIGVERVANTLKSLGVERELFVVPSLLLGSANLSVFEVAQYYQTLASDGFYTPLKAIRAVTTGDGERLKQYPMKIDQRVDRNAVFLLQAAMQQTAEWGTGRVVRQFLADGFRVAVKTGTSDGQRDSWFAGFSGDLLGVVWLGLDNNQTMPITGSSGAGQVWGDVFRRFSLQPLERVAGRGIEYAWIDEATGLRSAEHCEGAHYLPFIERSAPADAIPCANARAGWFKRLLQ